MKKISRRNFLAKTSAFGLFASTIQFLPSRILAKDAVAPSNRINVGCLGTGSISRGHLAFLASSPRAQIMAMCDVYAKTLRTSASTVNTNAKKNTEVPFRAVDTCEDYLEILERDDIDAVWICTPDHWHVQMAIAAINRGKAVYVEKPISLTIEEGRILADLVKKKNATLQVGTQQRSMEQFRLAAQLVRNGYLGNIQKVNISLGKFPPIPNLEEQEIPTGLNYDKWLGQTPVRPYHANRISGKANGGWRCFYEYGARKDGDWGAHHYDIVQWALNRDTSGACEFHPEDSNGEKYRHYKYDTGETVFVNTPDMTGQMIRFIGDEAEILVSRNGISCTKPELLKQKMSSKDDFLEVSLDHRANFLDAIAYGHKNIAQAETGHRTGTVCQLMSIARRCKESIKWNPATETITEGSDTAKSMLSRERRAPYFLEI